MNSAIDPATEAFLESIRRDLQHQLSVSCHIDALDADVRPPQVELRAWITVGTDWLEVTGTGETLVEAYANLRRSTSVHVLESAYRQVLQTSNR